MDGQLNVVNGRGRGVRLPSAHRLLSEDRGSAQPSMRILYVIFVLCVGALVWAALAAARHIRRHESKTERPGKPAPPTPPSPALEAAGKASAESMELHPEEAHHD
jgi:hypothetical protein